MILLSVSCKSCQARGATSWALYQIHYVILLKTPWNVCKVTGLTGANKQDHGQQTINLEHLLCAGLDSAEGDGEKKGCLLVLHSIYHTNPRGTYHKC